jgi:hypothetical protein
MRKFALFGAFVLAWTLVACVSQAAEQKTEKYAILEDPGEIGLVIEADLNYNADSGSIFGEVKKVTVGGKPLELVRNVIVNDNGRIKISHGRGMFERLVWLTPSQKARLKAVYLENRSSSVNSVP